MIASCSLRLRPSRASRAVASRPALTSLRASLPLPSVATEISGHQLKTETILPCGFEKVLSNTSVRYFEDQIVVRLPP